MNQLRLIRRTTSAGAGEIDADSPSAPTHVVPALYYLLFAVKNGGTAGGVEVRLQADGGFSPYFRFRGYLAVNEPATFFWLIPPGLQGLDLLTQAANYIDGRPFNVKIVWTVPSGATVYNAVAVWSHERAVLESVAV